MHRYFCRTRLAVLGPARRQIERAVRLTQIVGGVPLGGGCASIAMLANGRGIVRTRVVFRIGAKEMGTMTQSPADSPSSAHHLIKTPAKVNLWLQVLGRRADGFHELRSLAVAVGLFDELTFESAPAGQFELRCDEPALAKGDQNLVVRAARLLAERTGARHGARITLRKRIPVAAGMGGGSSDAAATLVELNRLWQTGLSAEALAALGAEIGSDVPLFFCLPAAQLAGRGEQVAPVGMQWSGWALLILGGVEVSTPKVYGAWRAEDVELAGRDGISRLLAATSAEEVGRLLANDLEPAVFRVCPLVGRLCEQIRGILDAPVRVSGAGSTLFALFDSPQQARRAADRVEWLGLRTLVAGVGDNAGRTLSD